MKRYINNWKTWLIVALIFLIAVQILFSIPAPCKILDAAWEAGDLISLVGTLILGYIATKQTNEANERADAANKISHRLMDLEFERHKSENRPFVLVTDWKVESISQSQVYNPEKLLLQIDSYDECLPILGLSISVQNTTSAPLSIEFMNGCIREIPFYCSTVNQHRQKVMLQPLGIQEITFYSSEEAILALSGQVLKLNFVLENRFAERYKESFKVIISTISNLVKSPSNVWFCRLFAQDYEIGKFIKDETGEILLEMENPKYGHTQIGTASTQDIDNTRM